MHRGKGLDRRIFVKLVQIIISGWLNPIYFSSLQWILVTFVIRKKCQLKVVSQSKVFMAIFKFLESLNQLESWAGIKGEMQI